MKITLLHRFPSTLALALLQFLLIVGLSAPASAAKSRLLNIREGVHLDHARIVLDCDGELPTAIGPAQAAFFPVEFDELEVDANLDEIAQGMRGPVDQIDAHKTDSGNAVKLSFKDQNVRVSSFLLRSGNTTDHRYRVVMDIYTAPPASPPAAKQAAGTIAVTTAAASQTPQESAPETSAAIATTSAATLPVAMPLVVEKSAAALPNTAKMSAGSTQAAAGPAPGGESGTAEPRAEVSENEGGGEESESDLTYSAEASLIARAVDGADESSKFDEYSDITQPISGQINFEAQKGPRFHLRGKATDIGQADQFIGIQGGDYTNFDADLSYDKSIHRYAFDALTLYSGVGSDAMGLDDALQANIQAAPTSAEVANRLNGFLSSGTTGDPEVTGDRVKLGLNVYAFNPFTIKLELANQKRKGTRPFAGTFSVSEMVELFEPIDYDTLDMKVSAEYASTPVYLNVAYHYSQFSNNTNTLTFDNPLRVADAIGGPSNGRIDLAPDNQYHNASVTGALTKLPLNSQVTANAAWGLMTQDDDLVPFTTNTAITAPALPVKSIDARVQTTLYDLRLTSRPLAFMRVKGHARYYDYDNQTDRIDFSGGYVETDAFAIATAINNLPSSYTKTRAGLDVGFDIFKRTSLGVGYQYEKTDRKNREVEEQDDHTYKLSADNRTLDWLELRASYERTNREIGDYNFEVYLNSGEDLNQLPQLRKYDQADLVRDRLNLQATFYPTEILTFSGALTYGKDDYTDSPYGLVEDNHIIMAFDADYAIGAHTTVNLFYNYETYENTQRSSSGGSDWTADGEDKIQTFGGGLTTALIPDLLDVALTYAYSDVDGNIAFTSPSGTFADFTAVDDTKLHALDTKAKYHYSKNLTFSLGYLWQKFDYSDLSTDGFSYVPTDAAGGYQGALLSGTLPRDYDVQIFYTQLTYRFP
jgi:MtrB/PioB family decaheme-associated outer membrane protein